jgi:hypothetical protein
VKAHFARTLAVELVSRILNFLTSVDSDSIGLGEALLPLSRRIGLGNFQKALFSSFFNPIGGPELGTLASLSSSHRGLLGFLIRALETLA